MDEFVMLRSLIDSRVGLCPDCSDERYLMPVDEDRLEWCCVDCGAAFATGRTWTAPAAQTPSRVA